MPCSPETPVVWSNVYAIATRIDDLAQTLDTPGYSKLRDVKDMPFKFPDLVDFNGAIQFGVIYGTIQVITQHLSSGVTSTAPHRLDPVLNEMGKKNELFLLVMEDGCWCSTLFKIDTNPGVPRVKQTEQLGCCQSLFVPQPGDSLDDSQHIIPSRFASAYAAGGNPEEGVIWQIEPACATGNAVCGYKFLTPELESPLTNCTRQIINGKFTWPMKASYMDKMIEKLKYILACENSGGAAHEKLQTGDPEEPYITRGCPVTICDLVRDRVARGMMDYHTPGCVSEGCNEESTSETPTSEPNPYPWNAVTCGGIQCESKGPRYYCRTIEDLEAILAAAEQGLQPYNPPDGACRPCICSWGIECESTGGEGESCLIMGGLGGTAVTGFSDITICEANDGTITRNIFRYQFLNNILQWCNGSLAAPDLCGTVLVSDEQDCEGGGNQTSVVEYDIGGRPDWGNLQSVANAMHLAGCPTDFCGAYSELRYDTPSDIRFFPGYPSAWASKSAGKVRFRMLGSYGCTGTQTPTRSVRYRKIVASHDSETITEHTMTANWSSEERTYVTAWIEQAPLSWPDPPDPPDTWLTYRAVIYQLISGDKECPEECPPG